MRHILITLSLLCAVSAVGQTEVIRMNEAKSSDQGLAYSLPKTVLHVNLSTAKLTKKAGPYYKYAERYLGVKDVITENSIEWIIENIQVEAAATPDLSNSFLILFKSTPAPTIDLTKDGMIRALNMEYVADPAEKNTKEKTDAKEDSGNAPMNVMSEELLMAGSTAKMAEIAAKQIYKLRESRTDLVTGNLDKLPADGESFKLMLKQLDDQEKALTALFTGSAIREPKVLTIEIEPTGDIDKQIITRFSKFMGVVDKNDLSGTPIYISLKTIEKRDLAIDPKWEKSRKGIVYRIPAKVQTQVTGLNNKVYASGNYQVAQMGSIASLSPNLFDNKKAPVKILFDPNTGAIRQMIQ